MFRTILLIIIFLLMLSKAYSQVNAKVRGTIVESGTNKTVEFASVILVKDSDSTMVQGTVTNARGDFEFQNVTGGKYRITYTFVGFSKSESKPFEISLVNPNLKLGRLPLSENQVNLKGVEIVGNKSTFESSIDRKTYNVEQDVMSKTGTISDVLQNVPTVQVDVEGKVSLRGSSNVMILINGKPSGMMNQNSAAMLQQLPASMVEKIEIITNPSARYRPDGSAGILNIVLKKNRGLGTNGSVLANAGNANRYNGGIVVSYNPGKINIFGNYNFRQDDYTRLYDSRTQKFVDEIERSNVKNTMNSHSRPVTNLLGLGVDYDMNKMNSLGLSAKYSHIYQCRNENSSFEKDSMTTLIKDYDRNRHPPKLETSCDWEGHLQHKFSKEGHEFDINFLNSFYSESTDNYFTNVYRFPDQGFSLDNVFYRHRTRLSQLEAAYANPLSKTTKLEAGCAFEFKQNDMKIYRDTFPANTSTTVYPDFSRTTQFLHEEYTNAVYVTLQQDFNHLGLLAGLRGEVTAISSDLYSGKPILRQHYNRLYPSLHAQYKITESNSAQLSYSRRIRRPTDEDFNPYPQYLDMWNLPKGNPNLQPEDIHSFEIGLKLKKHSFTFLSTLYYRYTNNGITTITETHSDTLISTLQNLSSGKATGLELVCSGSIGQWVNFNLNANGFYNVIDASALGYDKNKSAYSYTSKANASIALSKNTTWQVSANYTSDKLTPQGKLLPSFVLNTGVKQKVLHKKGAIMLTVSDVFNSLRSNLMIDTPELQRHEYKKRSARIIYLGLMYQFGSNGKKEKENGLQYDNKL